MKSWVLAAGLMAAAAATTGARAADLDEAVPPDRYGAYQDPRYADMYAHPAPPAYVPPPGGPRYWGPPPPPPDVDRDYGGDYERPYGGERRYSYGPPPAPYGRGCAPREHIKQRLLSEGWGEFRDGEVTGAFATVTARRPNGRLFALTLDRCSGDILSARPIEEHPYGPYAYGPAPRRWDRPY
jgi:hypothetical protein